MQSAMQTGFFSNVTLWVARVFGILTVMFLVFDAVIKLMGIAPVVDSFALLGYPAGLAFGIGMLELALIAVYLVPRTSILGAVLLTGYLGGAIASHVRIGSELFSLIFPLMIGALLWGWLVVSDSRVRALLRDM